MNHWKGRMTLEMISLSASTKRMWPSWDLIFRPWICSQTHYPAGTQRWNNVDSTLCATWVPTALWSLLMPVLIAFQSLYITKTHLFKYIENFTTKNWKCSDKNSHIFHISAQNIDCGYSLEPPRRGGSNEYPQFMFLSRNKKNKVYPCKLQFYYIKVGFKGVKII